MSDEVDRLTRIVERLLVLTKLDAGGNSLKLEEVDIKSLISQVVKKTHTDCKCKGYCYIC